jgi:hypothetical protein
VSINKNTHNKTSCRGKYILPPPPHIFDGGGTQTIRHRTLRCEDIFNGSGAMTTGEVGNWAKLDKLATPSQPFYAFPVNSPSRAGHEPAPCDQGGVSPCNPRLICSPVASLRRAQSSRHWACDKSVKHVLPRNGPGTSTRSSLIFGPGKKPVDLFPRWKGALRPPLHDRQGPGCIRERNGFSQRHPFSHSTGQSAVERVTCTCGIH